MSDGRHALARHCAPALGRRSARCDRPRAPRNAEPRPGFGVSAFLLPVRAAWGLGGRRIPIAGGAGDNAASAVGVGAVAAGEGLSPGNLGRRFLRHRSLCQLARAEAARVLRCAAGALARHVGDVVGGFALSWISGVIDRGEEIVVCVDAAGVFARSRRTCRRTDLPAVSHGERTPYMICRDGPVRRTSPPAMAPTRSFTPCSRASCRLRGRGRCAGRGGRAPMPLLVVGAPVPVLGQTTPTSQA